MEARASILEPFAGLPVSIEEAKVHLRIDHADEDQVIHGLILAAAGEIDAPHGWLGRSLLPRTMRLTFDTMPCGVVDLPGPPVTGVVQIQVRDSEDELVTVYNAEDVVDDIDLHLDLSAEPAKAWPGDAGWPTDVKGGPDVLRIDYEAGYESAAAIPAPIRQWLLIRIGDLYRDREGTVLGTITSPLRHVDRMLDNWRVRA